MKKSFVLLFLWVLTFPLLAQQVLTLEQCRELAIQNNKELQIADAEVKKAAHSKKEALTKYFPSVSAGGTYLWNEKDIKLVDFGSLGTVGQLIPANIQDKFTLDIQNVWVGNVMLVQPVFMGGKIVSYNHIAAYAKELAESMNDLRLQEVIYGTDQAYWQVVSLVNKKKLADAYVELLRKTDYDIEVMQEEGLVTKADGLSVKVKLNEAEMMQTKVDNGLSLSKMLLAQLCGIPMNETYSLADEAIESLIMDEKLQSVDLNEAFLNRNELKSLDLAARIYKKKEAIALSEMLPSVALFGNYTVMNPNGHNGFKNKFDGAFHAGVMLSVPLTGWWGGTHKRNAAKAETLIQQLRYEDARDKIELEVNQSVYKQNEAQKKLFAASRNMDKADENLRMATVGFEEGVIPALNMMEAQTAWISAHAELIDAQIEVKLTDVYLSKALGKLATENNEHKTDLNN